MMERQSLFQETDFVVSEIICVCGICAASSVPEKSQWEALDLVTWPPLVPSRWLPVLKQPDLTMNSGYKLELMHDAGGPWLAVHPVHTVSLATAFICRGLGTDWVPCSFYCNIFESFQVNSGDSLKTAGLNVKSANNRLRSVDDYLKWPLCVPSGLVSWDGDCTRSTSRYILALKTDKHLKQTIILITFYKRILRQTLHI